VWLKIQSWKQVYTTILFMWHMSYLEMYMWSNEVEINVNTKDI
jgi:hypothetical protein